MVKSRVVKPQVKSELKKQWKGPPSPYRESLRLVGLELHNHILVMGYVPSYQIKTRQSGRIKGISRIIEKANRLSEGSSINSIEQLEEIVTDIAGVRATVDYLSQAKELKDFLVNHNKWQVTKIDDGVRTNGYRAIHIDVKANTTHFKEVRCEIQIRTLLQDAWAIWSHPMYEEYKRNLAKIPSEKLNLMKQLGDMLHVADEMAETLR